MPPRGITLSLSSSNYNLTPNLVIFELFKLFRRFTTLCKVTLTKISLSRYTRPTDKQLRQNRRVLTHDLLGRDYSLIDRSCRVNATTLCSWRINPKTYHKRHCELLLLTTTIFVQQMQDYGLSYRAPVAYPTRCVLGCCYCCCIWVDYRLL